MRPLLRVISEKDEFLGQLIECIQKIDCVEHFSNHLSLNQVDQSDVVRLFQHRVAEILARHLPSLKWSEEEQISSELKDSIDILGTASDVTVVIEIDKNRADQVSKKFVSRTALVPDRKLYYIALCYPGTERMSVGECVKYFEFCSRISRRLSNAFAGFIIPRAAHEVSATTGEVTGKRVADVHVSASPQPATPVDPTLESVIRGVKPRNVSWAQLRRGAESLLNHDPPYAASEARKRALDRSLARSISKKANLSVQELLAAIEQARLGRD